MAIFGTLGENNLGAISASISDTAVDVFVYDTTKDSDGGAWRKRTQNTSWYNETLNTQYRGSRREFPVVAVIVADATTDKVTIYDGDDPDLPMWMVFSAVNPQGILGWATNNYTRFKVAALNGILTSVSNDGGHLFKFVEDYVEIIYSSTSYPITSSRTIGGRNVQKVSNTSGGVTRTYVAVTYDMNDVVMTVLPNAPVDSATGLPVPTIAVATDSGVSVIKDDGSVINATGSGIYAFSKAITITEENYLWWLGDSYLTNDVLRDSWAVSLDNFPSSDFTWNSSTDNMSDGSYYALTTNGEQGEIKIGSGNTWAWNKQERNALGGPSGLAIHKPNIGSENNSLIVAITSDYNTGWMHGAIKGAFLSSTDTTDAVVAYSDGFSNNDNNWGLVDCSITSGNLVITQQNQARATDGDALNGIATGTKLVFTFTVSGSGTGAVLLDDDGAGAGVGGNTNYGSFSSTGSYIFTTTKTASPRLRFIRQNGSNDYNINFINITTECDRSIKNKGLSVFGTVPKNPVATGAELVSYGPFDNANYLKQLYTSDLDFGTDSFSVTWWQYITGDISNSEYVYDRQGSGGNRHAIYYTSGNNGSLSFYTNDGATSEIYAENINNYKDQWTCYTATRDSSGGGNLTIFINGKIGFRSSAMSVKNLNNSNAELFIGVRHSESQAASQGKFALMRFSKSIPSDEQIKKIYEDEKVLFQPNAKATLYGSSDAVTALAYDDGTDLLHVGTSAGRSDFQGLRQINNTTDPVTTAISAHDSLIIEQ